MINENNEFKLIDFGHAKDELNENIVMIAGTEIYLSPEMKTVVKCL